MDGKPVETWLRDRYWASKAFETAMAMESKKLKAWTAKVAAGGIVPNFGASASAMLSAVGRGLLPPPSLPLFL